MDKAIVQYQIARENIRKKALFSKTSNNPYFRPQAVKDYQYNKERKRKELIDEINRLNLKGDYGV